MSLSFLGQRWVAAPIKADLESEDIDGLSPLIHRCLATSPISGSLGSWLNPSMSQLLDPYLMKGMEAAVGRLSQAFERGERLRIVTDYDVDGTTSSLILQSLCKILSPGIAVDYHIPDRFVEGYGFSVQAAQKAADDGIDLILTADIGVRDHEAVSLAASLGVDVIICDHHLPAGESVPRDALVVLCPPQTDCPYPNADLAACGVSLKLAQAMLAQSSRPKGFQIKVLKSMMKIAAIGTVCDVVSLASLENRAIVAIGLDQLRKPMLSHSCGLQALMSVSGIEEGWVTATDIGYQLGPRINAAGRLHLATDVIELFQARSIPEARLKAMEIDRFNVERRAIEAKLVEEAMASLPDRKPDFILISGEESDGWHRGVVGIAAARIRDKTHRPTAVLSISGEQVRGSVRSTPHVHAVAALDSVSAYLSTYGGHAAAAGFSAAVSDIPAIEAGLNAHVESLLQGEIPVPEIHWTAQCEVSELSMKLAVDLGRLGPFGKANPKPVLMLSSVTPRGFRILKDKHLKFKIGDCDALWWSAVNHLEALQQGPVDIIGRLEINRFRQRSRLQFIVEDVRQSVLSSA